MPGQPTIPSFMADLPRARRALAYAQECHAGQQRDSDHAPFIIHPLEVAALLHNTGHPETVVTAGILHDTLEDTEAEPDDIAARFGDDVAALVRAMTEDPAIEPYEARKGALREQIAAFGPDAAAVYAADKVAKVRELRARLGRDPGLLEGEDDSPRLRLGHYEQSLEMLEQVAPDHPLVRQLRFELETIRALPPGWA
jgi:(p)ppGpp synthase/HD superfamily hydrolase